MFVLYDTNGLFGFDLIVNGSTTGTYYYRIDGKGEIIALTNSAGEVVANYIYDAWGFPTGITDADGNAITDSSHVGIVNPIRYKGYCYDTETGLYYLNSRYYDPEVCRFVSADNQLSTGDLSGLNLFAYCGNNPVNRTDPTGEAWLHWVLGAAVVAIAAVVTVATCGMSVAAAATAVGLVANGLAAATVASTVAASAFIGSAVVLGSAAFAAALNSSSAEDFGEQGNWGTVAATAGGALLGGVSGQSSYKASTPTTNTGKGFDTFGQLKKEIGSPGAGNEWHHIVEQSQIAKSGFNPQMIQNTNNIISINQITHRAISGYYSSVQPFTNGMIVRNWLAGQSFDSQYDFGVDVIRLFM